MSSWAESKEVLYLLYISISCIMSRWAESKRPVNLKGRCRRVVLYFTTVLASTPLSVTRNVILSVYGVILSGVEGCSVFTLHFVYTLHFNYSFHTSTPLSVAVNSAQRDYTMSSWAESKDVPYLLYYCLHFDSAQCDNARSVWQYNTKTHFFLL